MKVMTRLGAGVSVLAAGLICVSCSGDQAGNITAPSDGLERRVEGPFEFPDQPITGCSVTALDFFGDGGGMPFEVSCENMGDAVLQVLTRQYDPGGCLIGATGVVGFPGTSGHQYSFTATTSDCEYDGGSLKVCSTTLGGCTEVGLPRLQIVEPDRIRNVAN
jgi:hypothetical protein